MTTIFVTVWLLGALGITFLIPWAGGLRWGEIPGILACAALWPIIAGILIFAYIAVGPDDDNGFR